MAHALKTNMPNAFPVVGSLTAVHYTQLSGVWQPPCFCADLGCTCYTFICLFVCWPRSLLQACLLRWECDPALWQLHAFQELLN